MKFKKLLISIFIMLMNDSIFAGTISGDLGNRATPASGEYKIGYCYVMGKISLSNINDARYVKLSGTPINSNSKSFTLLRDVTRDYDQSYSVQTQYIQDTVTITLLDMNCNYTCEYTFQRNSNSPTLTKGDPDYCTASNQNLYILKACNNVIR